MNRKNTRLQDNDYLQGSKAGNEFVKVYTEPSTKNVALFFKELIWPNGKIN